MPHKRTGWVPQPQQHPTGPSSTKLDNDSISATVDFDIAKRVADQVDWSIWRAIYAGEFRLAVRCQRCGRWLTAGPSKRERVGAHCAAKAAAEVVSK